MDITSKVTNSIDLHEVHNIQTINNSLTLECTVEDILFNTDRKITIEVPKHLISGKMITEKTSGVSQTTKINLEIVCLTTFSTEGQEVVASITETV